MARLLFILPLFLIAGFARSSEFSLVNNENTDMPFLITLNEPYFKSLKQGVVHAVQSKHDLVSEFLNEHSGHFNGLTMRDLTFQREFQDKQISHWSMHHYKQHFNGIEVFGGDLKIKFNHNSHITSLNGVLLHPKDLLDVDTEASITETEAIQSTLKMVSLLHPESISWSVEPIGLLIYKQGLTGHSNYNTLHLVHKIVVRSSQPVTLGYEVFVDAHTGEIVSHMSIVRHALHRQILGFNWQDGSLQTAWDEVTDPKNTTDVTDDNLLLASKTVFTIFNNLIDYDSWDNNGTIMQMQVAPSLLQCPNAYFDGNHTFFCPGMAGIDVVAHEWGHAYVSTYGGNLVYQSQSGALNEAYADIIGESTQLMLQVPRYYPPRSSRKCDFNTSDSLRWIIGDQVTDAIPKLSTAGYTIGIRDMYNPTCYKHPSTTSDSTFVCNPAIDNGGVHSNSGVPNQAYALFVDGGVVNEVIVEGVGLIKGFNIYVRALGSHTSTTNFVQHAMLLTQACNEFAQNGTVLKDPISGESSNQIITAADCAQLELAVFATGLNKTVDCSGQISNAPTILSSPIVGTPLLNGTTTLSVVWTGTNFNSSIANATITELNYGIVLESSTLTFGGALDAILATYTSDKPLEPAMYSFKIEYSGKTFGPYSYQTWYPASVAKLSTSEVKSQSESWIEIEVKDTVREFKGCFGLGSRPTSEGDCLTCVFQYATTGGFRIDDHHVGCFTPSYVPSNVSLNVGLWLTHAQGGQFTQQLNFVESLSNSNSPVESPSNSPDSDSGQILSNINPWVVGAIALVLGAAIAVLITSLVCVKKYARKEVFDTF
jgi:Zn-dependent metalloprotease